ncbi:cystatin-like [Notechis scutatus]|uniref:Cystatin-like n=1 Tax=Notechis scutatus TaxID=8663 RepID=A0A6J1VKL4_9SAUR|nr:cystatin-like [Notechis scutatus]
MAKDERQMIMEAAAQTEAVSHYKKEQAVTYFNRGSMGAYYKHLEDGQLEFQEAIGIMVYVKMLLAKTNCTRTKEQEEAGVEYSRAYMEKEGCQLLPKLKQEKHNCTFGIFINMRTEKKAVVSQDCIITPRIKLPF